MSDSRRTRAKALFLQALDLPREDRGAFLQKACGPDRLLEQDVLSLIAAHEEARGFLESRQVAQTLGQGSSGGHDPLAGAVIGDYRVLGLLARGGMGAVYRAEQENPRREVALKLIDRMIASPELLRRFEVEAQVLARLQHPGIAQIYVAGTTWFEHGDRPYFAMELVEGLPLTTYAEEGNLGRRERLELLIKICGAVQHAHQVGVIHRDLKPANILVTADGQPKVLDFGVARSTDTDLQVTTVAGSRAGLIGTLAYMSPEQVRGNPDELDTRSDVYALGILCYELLTGHLPRDLKGKTLTDAIRAIVEDEPRTLGAPTNGRFPADLETIVAKALEGNRERRYDSASEFAADLRRFLDGQPISARPQSAIYQLRKLIVRNRLTTTLVAGLVLLTVGSAVLMGLQTRRTARERDRANLEASTATEVSTFLESLFLEADPEQALGEALTAREILDRGARRIETELENQQLVRARLLVILGKVYASLGHGNRAAELLEDAVALGRVLREQDRETASRSSLDLGLRLLAGWYAEQGRHDEAIAMSREALALAKSVFGAESKQYATGLNALAYQLSLVSSNDESRELIERGLELRERLLGPDHVDVGWSLYQYAWLLHSGGDDGKALEYFERACAIWERGFAPDHPQFATCLSDSSEVLASLGEFDRALERAERALAIRQKTLGRAHPAIADTLTDIGYLYWLSGNVPVCIRYYEDAAATYKASLGPGDSRVLRSLYYLAFINGRLNRRDEEEAALLEALDMARTHRGDEPGVVGEAAGKLGLLYARENRDDEARSLLREAVKFEQDAGDSRLENQISMRYALAHLLTGADEAEEALSSYQQVLAARLEHPEWKLPEPLSVRHRIGATLLRLRRTEQAELVFRELLAEAEQAPETSPFFPSNVRWLLGHCLFLLGNEEEARRHYDRVLGVAPETLSDDVYWFRLRSAENRAANGGLEQARRELRAALDAGLGAREGRLALTINPRLEPAARRELLREIARRKRPPEERAKS